MHCKNLIGEKNKLLDYTKGRNMFLMTDSDNV